MKRSTALAALLLVGTLAGCSTTDQATTASMAVTAEPEPILTLGAGDSLGWSIFANDVVLASRQKSNLERALAVETEE